jgi:cytochrome b561
MTEQPRYTLVAIALHWLLAILLVSMVFFGWYMEDLREALLAGDSGATLQEVQFAYNAHKTTGLLVLALSLARLGWRFTHKTPPLPEHMPAWEKLAANGTHWAFYAIMIGMPLGGLVAASATPFPSLLFNNPDLVIPKLPVPQTEAFAELAGSAHGAGGWAILGLLGLHVAAALKHQFIDKDGLLARMLPFLKG